MYLLVNVVSVLAFIASVLVGFYTYSKFAVLGRMPAVVLVGLFFVLTAVWVSGRIWMLMNQNQNPLSRQNGHGMN